MWLQSLPWLSFESSGTRSSCFLLRSKFSPTSSRSKSPYEILESRSWFPHGSSQEAPPEREHHSWQHGKSALRLSDRPVVAAKVNIEATYWAQRTSNFSTEFSSLLTFSLSAILLWKQQLSRESLNRFRDSLTWWLHREIGKDFEPNCHSWIFAQFFETLIVQSTIILKDSPIIP